MKVRPWAPLRRRWAPGGCTRAAPRSDGHGHTMAVGAHGGALEGRQRDVRHRFTAEVVSEGGPAHARCTRRRQSAVLPAAAATTGRTHATSGARSPPRRRRRALRERGPHRPPRRRRRRPRRASRRPSAAIQCKQPANPPINANRPPWRRSRCSQRAGRPSNLPRQAAPTPGSRRGRSSTPRRSARARSRARP